jgi:hypothetical protein
MQLRTATAEDKPEIIELLKMSLGESTIPKSELLWNWKHEQNPFGPSFLLLAHEGPQLVGLRAFMRWEWQWNGEIYRSIRAVDTATHPNHQGKGIFKKLTLHQIDICKQDGISFVFNTPNNQSKPGYLKMGWVEQGKLPLKFKLLRPLPMALNWIVNQNKAVTNEYDILPTETWESGIIDLINKAPKKADHVTCNLSPQYISWRYEKNPLFKYHYFTDNANFLMISRIKLHSFARELRIVEFMLLNPDFEVKRVNRDIGRQVNNFCKNNKIDFISLSGLQYNMHKNCFHWMGALPIRSMGPIITLKDLNMNEKFACLLEINNWSYSLGDLELF